MDIYRTIAKDLKEVKADKIEAYLAFVFLQLGGNYYLRYIEQLRERRKQEAEKKATP